MNDWNVVVSIRSEHFAPAWTLLKAFGELRKTGFFNVLTLAVPDIPLFLGQMKQRIGEDPTVVDCLGRVMPVTAAFIFQSPEEFEEKARQAVAAWVPALTEKSFHVRMHRRGFRGRLSSQDEERFLDRFLLECLEKAGTPGRITFDDPDLIIALETVGQRAGLSLWTREERLRYPFLRLD